MSRRPTSPHAGGLFQATTQTRYDAGRLNRAVQLRRVLEKSEEQSAGFLCPKSQPKCGQRHQTEVRVMTHEAVQKEKQIPRTGQGISLWCR